MIRSKPSANLRQRLAGCLLMLHEARLRIEDTHPAASWLKAAWDEVIVRDPPADPAESPPDVDLPRRHARYPCPHCRRLYSIIWIGRHVRSCKANPTAVPGP